MYTEEFWSSTEGQTIAWRYRHLRTRRLLLHGEPLRHGTKTDKRRRADDFKHGVSQLAEVRQGPLTGPVALDLDFHTSADQPPHLYHLAKRYLDLLGAAPPKAPAGGHRYLLYRDDRQVHLLHVRVWQPLGQTPGGVPANTAVLARPLRDVVADLDLADVLRNLIDDHDEESPFHVPEVPDVDLTPTFDLRTASGPAERQRWSDLNMWLQLHDRSRVQEALLAANDALVASVLSRSTTLINRTRRPGNSNDLFNSIAESDRDMLLSNVLHIPLPSLPGAKGERPVFRDGLRDQLKRWTRRWPVLNPLLVPVKAILLVVPPPNGKDLDNLVRDDVLPAVHEVLTPQLTPWITRFPQLTLDQQAGWRSQERQLRQLQQSSVNAYEVIQLTRVPDDPPNGFLRLVLGSGTTSGSTWSRLAGFVERHMDRT
ncbi:hypothetical protein [Amycolatopsis sp. BJA-103]|nr:hypothetical protein [Amycolatopsis sp. BJA-103]